MEKDRGTKIIAIVALLVAVVGLSLGFASFSQDLKIESSAEVNPTNDGKINIEFSSSGTSLVTDGGVTGVGSSTVEGVAVPTGATASIDNNENDAATISGLKATFTKPGQKVTYSFYATNQGTFKAFLRSVIYSNATGASVPINCTKKSADTTQDYVNNACSGISVTVKIGTGDTGTSSSKDDYSGHELAIGAYEPVVVEIAYDADSSEADGDFDVAIGDIKVNYSSVDRVVTP